MNELEIKILKTIIEYYGDLLKSLKKNPVGFAAAFKVNVENTIRYAEAVLDFDKKHKADRQKNWRYGQRARDGYTLIMHKMPVPINFSK